MTLSHTRALIQPLFGSKPFEVHKLFETVIKEVRMEGDNPHDIYLKYYSF